MVWLWRSWKKDWIKYPILHLDLNTEKYDTPESLDRILNDTLAKWEMVYGTAPSETSIPLRFKGIVQRACEQSGQRVVILIDEYDKPMLQAIGNEELGEKYRDTLKGFLFCAENDGRVYPLCPFDGSYQVW
ncbi:AAA family ATPase [Bacteroides fragilis]|nr:AAA family ATPase [Bacteroides fragilis]